MIEATHRGTAGLPRIAPLTLIALLTLISGVHSGLAASNDDAIVIHRSSRLGLPIFVAARDGGAIPLPVANLARRSLASDFFAARSDVFGIADPAAQLLITRIETDPLGWTHTTFDQRHAGLPVFSGILKVHQDPAGRILSVSGRYYPISIKFDATPSIQPVSAEQVALEAALAIAPSATPAVDFTELLIVDPGWYGDSIMGPHLAYHIVISDLSVPLREAFFIDAHSAEILDQWSLIHDAKSRAIHDGNGGSAVPGTLVRAEGDPAVVSPDDVNRAYDYYGDTYDYYFRAFGRDSIDDAGLIMRATVNSTSPPCPNAYWSGTQMVFCTGTVTDDVVGHELTHGVTQYTANLIYQNQSGQLNESFSDVFGELIDLFNGDAAFAGSPPGPAWGTHPTGPGLDTPNPLRGAGCSSRADGFPEGVRWLLGEDATAFGSEIRDMWNPPCRNHPDRANSPLQTCNPLDSGGVHSGSGVANHAFAIATDGKTFNGHTAVGIGPIKSAAVWYRALTTYLSPASDFEDAYIALRQSALDLVGFDPNDPRTGLPSGNPCTAADALDIDEALLAVEMNTPGACGQADSVLSSAAPIECGDFALIYADDFESGLNGWTVSNSAPPTPYDWVQTTGPLPGGRPGIAWFCDDASIGDCAGNNEAGVHSLFSPILALPPTATAPFCSFTHYLATEGGWDAGNLKISVNNGAWSVVPRSAFRFNPYNGRINSAAQGNTDPLAGQHGWTGAGGSWGRSVVDLRTLVAPNNTVQFRFDFGKDGCTGGDGWYVNDFRFYDCLDCDQNAAIDFDELYFSNASDPLGNIGTGSPQNHTITAPPTADGDVILTFNARGDFSLNTEFLDITVNGQFIGRVLDTNAGDCPGTPESQDLLVPASTWNLAVAGGNALITMTASPDVGPAITPCDGETYVAVFARYPLAAPDCNQNIALDPCERQAAGIPGFVAALLNPSPDACIYDMQADGDVNGADVQPYVDSQLSP